MQFLNCKLLALALLAASGIPACAQQILGTSYGFANFAGNPYGMSGTNDGRGSAATFNALRGLALDSAGNLYVADEFSMTIRKTDTNANVTTVAGTAYAAGATDGPATNGALFNHPVGVTLDSAGNLYVADEVNMLIREIDTNGNVSTLAGNPGVIGSADGTGTNALFHWPNSVALDSSNNIYTADAGNSTIRKITPAGVVTTIAGTGGRTGSVDGAGSNAQFSTPLAVAVDAAGTLYVADTYNYTIRKIDTHGNVTTVGGSPGQWGSADGFGSAARFYQPHGIAVNSSGSVVYVGDYYNYRVSKGIKIVAQAAVLGIQLNQGILVQGTVGAHYQVQYSTALDPNNWILLQDIPALPSSPYIVVDPALVPAGQRSYRAISL
jgi:hypothetical protein